VTFAARLGGELDETAFARAFDAVAARHEALRSRFVTGDDGAPEVVVDPDPKVRLSWADGTEDELARMIREEAARPFDLATGPLFRALVVRLAPDDHAAVLTMLHTVTDGWSFDIVVEELAAVGRCRVINHYGPTEATVGVTTYAVEPDGRAGGMALPIGRPMPGAAVWVLDRHLQPVPVGEPGEVYLGGRRLARGYLDRPGLTADRFIPDPYGEPGARMYHTGDLGRWLPSGELEFLGRTDFQVKIRGYRVEPAEIEAVLGGLPEVAQAVVELRAAWGGPRRRRLRGDLVGLEAVRDRR
jgi:non-ribosomal peptide synthetase component F